MLDVDNLDTKLRIYFKLSLVGHFDANLGVYMVDMGNLVVNLVVTL
jgi:hypothetical protein